MQNRWVLALAAVATWQVTACQQVKSSPPSGASAARSSANGGEAALRPGGAAGAGQCCGGHRCNQDDDTKLLNDRVTSKTGPDGKAVLQAGNPFARQTPTVQLAELLAKPDRYKGKKVRVAGNVSAMCGRRRRWFAMTAGDRSGGFLRVITTPFFLVPAGMIGKQAAAEGTVEVIAVSARAARHFARRHGLGDPEAIAGIQRRVVLRATGAAFR